MPPAVWSGPAAISARARTGLTAPAVITGDSSRPVKGFRVVPAADITAPRTRLPGPAGPGQAAGTGPVTLDQDPAPPESGPAANWPGASPPNVAVTTDQELISSAPGPVRAAAAPGPVIRAGCSCSSRISATPGPAQGSAADTSTWGAAARWVGWTSRTRLTGPSASARPPPGINA